MRFCCVADPAAVSCRWRANGDPLVGLMRSRLGGTGMGAPKTARGDTLAAEFNMPIYVTEMDIDQADDQEQLASMQQEITMFWEHPNVHGITYWGGLQGSMRRTNAWLVDSSGNERPAMTWLQEFIQSHR